MPCATLLIYVVPCTAVKPCRTPLTRARGGGVTCIFRQSIRDAIERTRCVGSSTPLLFIHSISVIYSHITLTHHTTRTTEFSRRRPPGTGATGTQSESQMLADRMGLALYLCTALYVCLYGTLSLYRACTLPQFPFPRIPGSKEAVPTSQAHCRHTSCTTTTY